MQRHSESNVCKIRNSKMQRNSESNVRKIRNSRMQRDSESNLCKIRNEYDNDLTIIPEVVDSALAHFFMKELWEPMGLEIRIVPEIQNRRKMTLIMGDKKSMHIEENKYVHPCVCKRQLEEEIQRLRLHMAFDEIRKRWHQVYSGDANTKSSYEHNLYVPKTCSSTSTSKPLAVSRSASFNRRSFINTMRSSYSTLHRSRSF
uniref:Uncharacterized protein n=1 Tax=Elaeophora elaphi TaxID=1147741 RepID=A0A0R3S1Q9_9BILA